MAAPCSEAQGKVWCACHHFIFFLISARRPASNDRPYGAFLAACHCACHFCVYTLYTLWLGRIKMPACLFIAAVAEEVSVPNQRLPDTSLPDRDQVGLTSDHPRASESSTASSATDHDRQEPKTAAADQPGGNGTSDGDTDTVSATMWFDRPEIATSFVTCDASDDDDAESVNSNHNENGKTNGSEFWW